MASPLLGLPDELLQMNLLKVPKKDTKAAQLTCTRLAGIGAQYLFQRIYFAPRRKVMEDFKCIISNPIFCKSVEELVYDSRLFIEYKFHEGNPWECASGCTRKTPPGKGCGWEAMYLTVSGSMDVVALARKYIGFYTDQRAIFKNGDDFHLLCEGLHHLPKISTLTLWDDFRHDPDCSSALPCAHDWYMRRTLKEISISTRPSYGKSTDNASQTGDDELIHRCDVRGVCRLYKALKLANVKLDSHLVIDLTQWNVQIDWESSLSETVESQQCSPDMISSSLLDFLTSLKLLERLGVIGQGYEDSDPWIICFEGLHWRQLKSLKLSYVIISRNELESLISTHRLSLRELTLDRVDLVNGLSKVADWNTMTKEMGAFLTLNVVTLANLMEDRNDSGVPHWLEDEHHKALAGNLMGQHPYTVFLEEVNWDSVAVARRT